MTPVEFHSEALLELEEAHAWYEELDELVATAFLTEINRSVAKISERPESWPKTRDNERRFLLNQFPYFSYLPSAKQRRLRDSVCAP